MNVRRFLQAKITGLSARLSRLARVDNAFVGLRPVLVERLGDEQVDQCIAEELEALVVRSACAAVGQGLRQQVLSRESISQIAHPPAVRVRIFSAWNFPTTSRLAINGLRVS